MTCARDGPRDPVPQLEVFIAGIFTFYVPKSSISSEVAGEERDRARRMRHWPDGPGNVACLPLCLADQTGGCAWRVGFPNSVCLLETPGSEPILALE